MTQIHFWCWFCGLVFHVRFALHVRANTIIWRMSPWWIRPDVTVMFDSALQINYQSILGGIYVPCIYRMPGGVIVGDSGLCCCGSAFNVWRQLFERNYFPFFVDAIISDKRDFKKSILYLMMTPILVAMLLLRLVVSANFCCFMRELTLYFP